MATTSPDNIYYPVASDSIAPLETVFSTMASSVQSALTGTRAAYSYRWADQAARIAQTGMRKFDRGVQVDTNAEWVYTGTQWLAADTGWTNLPLRSGVSAVAGDTPMYRRINGQTWVKGAATGMAAGAVIGTLPSDFRPDSSYTLFPTTSYDGNSTYRVTVATSGDISATNSGSSAQVMFYLNFPTLMN